MANNDSTSIPAKQKIIKGLDECPNAQYKTDSLVLK
jgi:hypothetical protein